MAPRRKDYQQAGDASVNAAVVLPQPTVWRFIAYFLRLGALGFGGPVALANYMRRDLVEARGWITDDELAVLRDLETTKGQVR